MDGNLTKLFDSINKLINKLINLKDWRQLFALVCLGVVVGSVFFIKNTDDEFSKLIAYTCMVGVSILFLLICLFYRTKSKDDGSIKEPSISKGRYFIGIDIGRDKIDYCLLDYDKFKKEEKCKIKEGNTVTPANFQYVNEELVKIVKGLLEWAKVKNIKPISGIGLGLPGQVNPIKGELIYSPGYKSVQNQPVIDDLKGSIYSELRGLLSELFEKLPNQIYFAKDNLKIAIDNDVRCSTRYLWKKHSAKNMISIFSGIGLGSGIVLGGKMLYGYDFTAGEIGHTTISDCRGDPSCLEKCLLGSKKYKCMCGMDGCHLEKYVSREGMLNIAKNLDPKQYLRLKQEYEMLIKTGPYLTLLEQDDFRGHPHINEKNGELTTYFFSLAFYAGDTYVCEVVKRFIKYLSIGIANYINIINPRRVYLGGGMIKGFYDDKKQSPLLKMPTSVLLRDEIKKYALSVASNVAIFKRDYSETKIPSIGAALIFKDQSYFDYIRKKRES